MKRLLVTGIVLSCLGLCCAQGLQGNVTISGSAITVTGHSVTLTWNASQGATSYNVYRGNVSGGPYVQIASGIVATTYTDTQVGHSQTLYYVTTAINAGNESRNSNEAVAVIP